MSTLNILHPRSTYRYLLVSNLSKKEIADNLRKFTDTQRTGMKDFLNYSNNYFYGGINNLTGIITLERKSGFMKDRTPIQIKGKIEDKQDYRGIFLEISFHPAKYIILFIYSIFLLAFTVISIADHFIPFHLPMIIIPGIVYLLTAFKIENEQKEIINFITSVTNSAIKTSPDIE